MFNRPQRRIAEARVRIGQIWEAGFGLAAATAALAVLALLTPFAASFDTGPRVGVLLATASLIEFLHSFRRSTVQSRRSAWQSAAITAGMAALLISAPLLAATALVVFVAGTFALDGVRLGVALFRQTDRPGADWRRTALGVAGNAAAVVVLLAIRGRGVDWTLAAAGALRMFGVAWTLATAPVLTEADAGDAAVRDLGIPDHPALAELGARLEREETARRTVDRGWVVAFLASLFAIHLGRIGMDKSALGVLSPAVAMLGDVVFALVIAFGIVIPFMLFERRLARPLERLAWRWRLGGPASPRLVRRWSGRVVNVWLEWRLRLAVRMGLARFSMPAAIGRGLQIGLPFAAILAATVPLWGMSWYFDTENWAAGVWNSWAESRTDAWRESMVRAVVAAETSGGKPAPSFTVHPPGLPNDGAFSFIVIGDTGEGDASQHVLRDQLLKATANDDVRFVVLSSDVVYPVGAMRDYEAKFWLPFKGIEKPVYAIPGNHDWYDGLEAFVATFYDPAAARVAIEARVDADGHMSTTTAGRIEELIARAAELRRLYRVPTGFQQAPFFQIQTDAFALIAVDTGVLKRVDREQMAWFDQALKASHGKMTMAVLGHPFYAGGARQDLDNEAFAGIHRMLQAHHVPIVMAGDTHDLEYYVEPGAGGSGSGAVHFVNGGGGAYLSFGTALAWPSNPATRDWAFYPTTADVTGKIEIRTPWYKRPAWWWTRATGAWPFSPEWLSAAFDYNVAPFFQSFVEVRVEPATRIVRILPWGIHGRLRWSDLQRSPSLSVHPASDLVEWVVRPER